MRVAIMLGWLPAVFAPSVMATDRELVRLPSTAVAIAEAVAIETYGAEVVASQRPLSAVRSGRSWVVKGSHPPLTPGGVVEVEIAARDGRVIRLTHGK